ncbi:MAG: ATP-binding cassette domain-containing protein, partial [Clostridia bacterium]|nr:ATP-binding cassette domain-containing protein [Clostridia bacterium]
MDGIVLCGINKRFGEKQVLSGFSLSVPAGGRICLMGGSGSGKTTVLNIILGLVKPDSGTVSGVPQKVAAVFQEDRLPEYLSAAANVRFVTGSALPDGEITALLRELGLAGS